MRLRRMFTILDSRLRGNDGGFEAFGQNERRTVTKQAHIHHIPCPLYFTLTLMVRIAATPRMMKNPQVFVAGFKPAQGVSGTHQECFRRRAGLKPAPTQPRFVLTSEMYFTPPFMAVTPPEDEISASLVGAGFKPALRREIGSIGLKHAPTKPCFVVTSEMFFTLNG